MIHQMIAIGAREADTDASRHLKAFARATPD
jgi:hypothetical protein